MYSVGSSEEGNIRLSKCTGFKTLVMDEDQSNNFKQCDILPSKRLTTLIFVT